MRDFSSNKVIVTWAIPTFDPTRPDPFPLDIRHFYLDLEEIDSELAQEIFDRLEGVWPPLSKTPPTDGWTIKIDHAPAQPDYGFLKYRSLFRRDDNNAVSTRLESKTVISVRTMSPNLMGDYFENEDGSSTTNQAMLEHLNPGMEPLIMFDVPSVLRIGPVVPRDIPAWNSGTADTISHFLYVTEKILRSRWIKAPLTITFVDGTQVSGRVLDYAGPDSASTLEMLALIRQLYATDDLFNRAANLYMRHLSNDGKRIWSAQVKRMFNEQRDGEPMVSKIAGYSRRKLIDTFIYGAGLLHSGVQKEDQANLVQLLATHGRERVMVAVISCMRDIVVWASMLSAPMRQDYVHWTSVLGFATPTRPNVDTLFGR